MKEKVTPFVKSLASNPAIRNQYFIGKTEPKESSYNDPLMEDKHEVVKGLVHKYGNRALIKVSYLCAAYCRFCTRIRQIGNPEGTLTETDIENIKGYLITNPQIDDVILSGGDPFYTPKITAKLLTELTELDSVKTIRIGTRMPFQSPCSFQSKAILDLLKLVDETGHQKPFFILLHIEHPDELTPETEAVIALLRQHKVTLLSQTVFLKGINDQFETLHELFKRLYHRGVIPYYLYHCDPVKGLEHFQGDLEKEKKIAIRLRQELSGIACPLFVEDIEDGYGKILV
jgi:lysine 2,3-aminomutase